VLFLPRLLVYHPLTDSSDCGSTPRPEGWWGKRRRLGDAAGDDLTPLPPEHRGATYQERERYLYLG